MFLSTLLVLAQISALPVAQALAAPPLELRLEQGNFIRISAPGFQFLTGKPLERLKNGRSVSFFGQLSISTDGNRTVQKRELTRFVLSYDIWEERFSAIRYPVSQVEQAARKSAPLTESAVQNWCLENFTIDASEFPLSQQLWLRLELRADDVRDTAGLIGEPGISISRLIDLFSQPARTSQERWQLDSGPFRLSDLKKKF
jgi:hypothetical protein